MSGFEYHIIFIPSKSQINIWKSEIFVKRTVFTFSLCLQAFAEPIYFWKSDGSSKSSGENKILNSAYLAHFSEDG